MRIPEPVRAVILAILPWYHADEVEARHAETRRVLRDASDQRRRVER